MTCLFMFNGSLRLFIVRYLPSPSSLPPFSNTKMFWFCSEFSLEKSEFRHVNTSSFPSDILQSDAVTYISVRYAFACSGVGRGCDRLPPPSGNARRETMPSTSRALRPPRRGGPRKEPCLCFTAWPGLLLRHHWVPCCCILCHVPCCGRAARQLRVLLPMAGKWSNWC